MSNKSIIVFLIGLCILAGMYHLACIALPYAIVQKAETVAGDQPYCIQVDDKDYRAAKSLWDLTGYNMNGVRNFHAIMVVGDSEEPLLLNWSYGHFTFVNERLNKDYMAIYCMPKPHFARQLPFFPPEKSEDVYIRYFGYRFRIPLNYLPDVQPHAQQHIAFSASLPDFEPLDAIAKKQPMTILLQYQIDLYMNGKKAMDEWASIAAGDHPVELQGEYGLRKRSLGSRHRYTEYYAVDQGQITALIMCSGKPAPTNPLPCRHLLLHKGILYMFHHTPADLPKWQILQRRLIKKVEDFTMKSPAP